MKKQTVLLTGAAVGVLMLGVCAPAQASTKHHKRAAAGPTAEQMEIKELKSEVQALTSRLDAAEANGQQAKAQAANAEAVAMETKQEQAAVNDQVQDIPTAVNLAVSTIPKPVKTWAESTSVNGRMYFDITNIEQKSNGAKVPATGTGFDIKRFYVGIDHKFNDTYSANVTTDFQFASAISSTELFLKKAYLQGKYADALIIRAGAADLPWIPYAEGVYNYRHVEQTLTDRTKFGTSSDWGLHALGSFNKGMFNYQVSVVDGAGYKAPLRSKGMDVEGRVDAKVDKFVVAVGGYTGKLGKEAQGVTTFHTATRVNALAAYVDPKFRVGGEYFTAKNWTAVTSVAGDSADGYSAFGSFNFTDKISAFGRYDWVKPNKDTAPTKRDEYFNFGVQFEPTKIVDLALVYKRDDVANGSLSTGNGTIGGTIKGTYDEVGLFGQLRW